MTCSFTEKLPEELSVTPVLISGADSELSRGIQYLIVNDGNTDLVYEIRYDYHCSPFKAAIILNNRLAVGFEEYFYLFDQSDNINLLKLKMDGYFGQLHVDEDLFYVADASGLFCIDHNGNIIWHNDGLGIDGVIVSDLTVDEIHGSGEWDPPGGWRDFIIDKRTGITKA